MKRRRTEAAVTIGNFDGVHLGHQAIVSKLLEVAKKRNVKSVAMTFDPHPAEVLGVSSPKLLTPLFRKKELLLSLGIDEVLVQPFTSEMAKQHARTFIEETLVKNMNMTALVVGPNTHIVRAREGTPDVIRSLSKEMGFDFSVAEPLLFEGGMVSSSRIRNELGLGDVSAAYRLLTRYHETWGQVTAGDGRGTKIGFPTANVAIDSKMMTPGTGVYATWAVHQGERFQSVTNVGFRPTFYHATQSPILTIETHLLGFKGDLKGEPISLQWVGRIRSEKKFSSGEALGEQIQRDLERAREVLDAQ